MVELAYTAEHRHRDIILGKLAEMEMRHNVEVILAVESGSRAWGYPSADSDYDVRFVYRQRPADYVRLVRNPDTLGRPAPGALYDVTGWDVEKALKLSLSSNATVLEWLRSPVRYRWSEQAEQLNSVATRVANPRALTWHYYNMSRDFVKLTQDGGPVKLKKYFYGLRPALALRHLRMFSGPPPMNLQELVDSTDLTAEQVRAIAALVETKAAGREDVTGHGAATLDALVRAELETAEASKPEKGQLVSDETLRAMAERNFLRIIGLEQAVG